MCYLSTVDSKLRSDEYQLQILLLERLLGSQRKRNSLQGLVVSSRTKQESEEIVCRVNAAS
jgi:hypothetical protein